MRGRGRRQGRRGTYVTGGRKYGIYCRSSKGRTGQKTCWYTKQNKNKKRSKRHAESFAKTKKKFVVIFYARKVLFIAVLPATEDVSKQANHKNDNRHKQPCGDTQEDKRQTRSRHRSSGMRSFLLIKKNYKIIISQLRFNCSI